MVEHIEQFCCRDHIVSFAGERFQKVISAVVVTLENEWIAPEFVTSRGATSGSTRVNAQAVAMCERPNGKIYLPK